MVYRGDVELPCPACLHVGLVAEEVMETTRLACTQCGGLWLDVPTLDHVARMVRVSLALPLGRAAGVSERRCPHCKNPLEVQRVQPGDVEVDVCPGHGAWFDPEELTRLLSTLPQAPYGWLFSYDKI